MNTNPQHPQHPQHPQDPCQPQDRRRPEGLRAGGDTNPETGGVYPSTWTWPGIRLGWQGPHVIHAGPQNATLVLGPPRSGKTTGIVAAAVAEAPGPVVATSTKTDLAELTATWREPKGRCWYFDPSATTPTPPGLTALRWSPLHGCADWPTAISRAHALACIADNPYGDNTHWVERAETLLAALLHAAAHADTTMSWVLRSILRRDLHDALGTLAVTPADTLAAHSLQGIAETDERERSGIFSTAARLLSAYRNPKALDATTNTNFNPDTFVHSADTIYLVAPSTIQTLLAPIVISLLEEIRDATYKRHPSWPPTLYALDEAANIAPLPDLPAILAEGASQGLVTLTCLQDLNQARTRWGRQADGFLTLHAVKIALGGIADPPTLQALSYLAGNIDVTYKTHSGYHQGLIENISWNQTVAQRPRIPPETINTLPRHTAYLAHSTHQPRIITLYPPPPPPQPQNKPTRRTRIADALNRITNPTHKGDSK